MVIYFIALEYNNFETHKYVYMCMKQSHNAVCTRLEIKLNEMARS